MKPIENNGKTLKIMFDIANESFKRFWIWGSIRGRFEFSVCSFSEAQSASAHSAGPCFYVCVCVGLGGVELRV